VLVYSNNLWLDESSRVDAVLDSIAPLFPNSREIQRHHTDRISGRWSYGNAETLALKRTASECSCHERYRSAILSLDPNQRLVTEKQHFHRLRSVCYRNFAL
jgi:hypothetical protein